MPGTFPAFPGASIDAQNVLTISRFLNTPTLIERALRTLAQQRFVGDVLLTGRGNPSGGAIAYEQNESIYPDRAVEAVPAGGEFPLTGYTRGPAKVSRVRKWGIDALVTDEAVRRELRSPVDRALTKMANGVVRQVDSVALAAIAAAPIQTFSVATAWATTTRIIRDIAQAKAQILALNQGYDPDTLLMSDALAAIVYSDPNVVSAQRREDPSNFVYSGAPGKIVGLDPISTPNLPAGVSALILDRKVLGGLADEVPLSSTTIRDEEHEQWRLRAKRITVPYVVEPSAAINLIGV